MHAPTGLLTFERNELLMKYEGILNKILEHTTGTRTFYTDVNINYTSGLLRSSISFSHGLTLRFILVDG